MVYSLSLSHAENQLNFLIHGSEMVALPFLNIYGASHQNTSRACPAYSSDCTKLKIFTHVSVWAFSHNLKKNIYIILNVKLKGAALNKMHGSACSAFSFMHALLHALARIIFFLQASIYMDCDIYGRVNLSS